MIVVFIYVFEGEESHSLNEFEIVSCGCGPSIALVMAPGVTLLILVCSQCACVYWLVVYWLEALVWMPESWLVLCSSLACSLVMVGWLVVDWSR